MNASTTLLVLSADPTRPDLRLPADADGHRLRDDGGAAATRRLLVVPATELSLHWLPLKAATPAQARAAATHRLAGRLAQTAQALTIEVGTGEASRWVAVFTEAARTGWLARAAAHGFAPDAVVPDCLLLPAVADGDPPVVAGDGHLVRVRGHDFAFSAEPALAAVILGGELPASAEDAGRLQALLLAGATRPIELDLAPPKAGAGGRREVPTRRLLALAAAVLLAPLLVLAAQALRHELGVARAETRADQALLALAPGATGPGRPLARARAELARRQAPDRFGVLASALVEAQSQVPGTRLLSLGLADDGVMGARVSFQQTGQIDQLRLALAERGVALADQGSEADGAGWTTTLLLSDAP